MSAMPLGSSRIAFTYPNFSRFMTARFLVTVASEMQSVAVGWQVYAITRRPLDLGLVGLAQFLPAVCLFLVAGHVADRYRRTRILTVCFGSFAVCSALLLACTLLHVRSAYPLYAVLILNGTVRAFQGPAASAFIASLVKPEHFPNAVAWGSSIFQTATVVGPLAGGLIYGITGNPVPVYATAVFCYGFALLLITALKTLRPTPTGTAASAALVLEGLRYIWRNQLVLGSISLDLFAVLLGGAVALLPVYAEGILHVGALGLGILRSAPGVGAVMMGIAVAYLPIRKRAGLTMFSCVFAFGIFTVAFGLSRSLPLSVLSLLLAGAVDTVSVIVRSTLVQLSVPDSMRGRVSAVNGIFIGASNEFGQFESGLTAQWFGTVPAVIFGGVGTMVVVILWALWFPMLRKLDSLVPAEISSVSSNP